MTSMSLPGLTRQSIETKDASRLRIEVLGSSPRTALDRFALELASFSSSFAGLVVVARSLNPIPSRTRPLNSSAPMVLWLKPWESRSLPGLPRTRNFLFRCRIQRTPLPETEAAFFYARDCVAPASFRHDPRSAWRSSSRQLLATPDLLRPRSVEDRPTQVHGPFT